MVYNNMTYKLEESIVVAIFSKTPLIVVEGEDDIPFYKKIAEGKSLRVLSSELIKDKNDKYYLAGCTGVIKIVQDAQEVIIRNSLCKKFFLGIIDRDCRRYIGHSDIELECLFKLKYYSYESHFMTRHSVKNFIRHLTGISIVDISDEIINCAMSGLDEIENDLYYASLEALKGRCYSCYQRIVTYETRPEELYHKKNGSRIIDEVLKKKNALDEFAVSKNINYDDARYVVKGKWFLYAFVMKVYLNIRKLKERCNNNDIEQCDYCKNNKFDKCIWKKRIELKRSDYNECMINLNYDKEPELLYIKEAIMALG